MATTYKIYPAIGIARVGNSPDEFFIGPERIGEQPNPTGGFKDPQCRVKRQAARFRIFAQHDDNSIEEITDAEAEITWTVHLVNKKAAHPDRDNSESAANLTIDPGPRTLTGPNQLEKFDTGQINFSGESVVTVPLGEIRSDDDNHLLILGGYGKADSPQGTGISGFWGNDDWYDDVADGPVSATIKLRDTDEEPDVVSAWIITAPPKFAPHQDSVITLYDAVYQVMVDAGLSSAPTSTSYTDDVYPILQRGRDTKWVENVGFAHAWTDPVTSDSLRQIIFSRLTAPGDLVTDMPDLLESDATGRLSSIQYQHMERWKDNNYANDWSGSPPPQTNVTPDGMTRVALEACVGGAFFPGIEAGGRNDSERPITDAANYSESFRLDHSLVSPGDISYTMALPWQADFYACADNWWPVPRPNEVIRQGDSDYSNWDSDVGSYADMVAKWHSLGFIVEQGNEHVEVERCNTASITLLTPYLNFLDIPQGPMGMVREQPLAITFEVISPGGPVTLEYAPGGAPSHPQLTAYNSSDIVGPTAPNEVTKIQLWVIFETAGVGSIPIQSVTVREAGGGQQWTIMIDGNTVARRTTATALVLDRSGSMSEDRGDGESKHTSLQQAASIFVELMLDGDGVGVVRYNHDADQLQQVLKLGSGGLADINRGLTRDVINGPQLNPTGNTSIGDGIFEGRDILNNATDPYNEKALVVLTDGKENSSRYIADVADEINERTFSVGLGTPQNTSSTALQTISGNNGGYLLVTGAIAQDNRFVLQKYFLQILAGISNAEIVLDPTGELPRGQVHTIPFQLTEADSGVDVILLTPETKIVDFRLQTPSGLILEPWRAQAEAGMRYVLSNGVTYYRLVLPTQLQAGRFDRGGTWHVLLRIGYPQLKPSDNNEEGIDRSILYADQQVQGRSQRACLEAVRQAALREHDLSVNANATVAAATHAISHGDVRRTVPYSLIVHSYSSLSLSAELNQSGYEPGDEISIEIALTEAGIPVADGSASVWAEVTRPDGSTGDLTFAASEEGRFTGRLMATHVGVYKFRVRANGKTRRGQPYTRERSLTAPILRGGNSDPFGTTDPTDILIDILDQNDRRWCKLMSCLTGQGVIKPELEKQLREAGVDLNQLRKCLAKYCKRGKRRSSNRSG
jgi:hypothetical protein